MKSVVTKLLAAGLPLAVFASTASFASPEPRQPVVQENGNGGLELSEKDCRIELLKAKVVVVGATQTGKLTDVEPGEVGQLVENNQIVAKIDAGVMLKKLESAKKRSISDIEVRYAQKSFEVARERYRDALDNKGRYSKAEVINYKLEYEKTKLQIEKAEVDGSIQKLEVGEIEAELENYKMNAPISGEVTEILKRTGESVRQGDDIMQISDLSQVRAVGKIPTSVQNQVTKGTKVLLKLVGPNGQPAPFDNVFEGKITFIKPRVSRVSQRFEVYATINNQKDRNGNYILKEGMTNQLTVLLGSGRNRTSQADAPQRRINGGVRPADFRQPAARNTNRIRGFQK